MFHITIEAETLETLKDKLAKLTALLCPVNHTLDQGTVSNIMLSTRTESASPDQTAQVEKQHNNVSELGKRKKPGRPKKNSDVPENLTNSVPEAAAAAEPQIADEGPQPSRQEVIEALQDFNVRLGMPEARKLLARFECQRVSDLKPHQYHSFIQACRG